VFRIRIAFAVATCSFKAIWRQEGHWKTKESSVVYASQLPWCTRGKRGRQLRNATLAAWRQRQLLHRQCQAFVHTHSATMPGCASLCRTRLSANSPGTRRSPCKRCEFPYKQRHRSGWRLNGSREACLAVCGCSGPQVSQCFRSFESSFLSLSLAAQAVRLAQKGLRAGANR
jgi:hypothetical protein